MLLIIAEKPSVGRAISSVVGAGRTGKGYIEGNGYIVSWCVGHLVGLKYPNDYGNGWEQKWSFSQLPMIPEAWQFKVTESTKEQFGIIKALMGRDDVSEIICATDADREGECIFRYVYQMARCRKPVKRLWVSSLEESAIRSALGSMKPMSAYDNLFYAGYSRARADWLVGMNGSRLFSCRYGGKLNIGRVQTPTLAIGGHTGEGNISHVHYDGKGLTFDFENGEKFRHSWYNVASMTDARLKTDSYLSAEQRTAYEQMKADKAEEQTAENPEARNKIEIGDKFRNKLTGEVCEVVSLEGALPYYTDDCTVQRDSGGFMITENISYDKLLNSGLYEYIGRAEQEKEQLEAVKLEPVRADETLEAEKPEIPTVNNLSQLKKALKPGMMFEITDHLRPECIGERRMVTGVNTVEFTSRKLDENGEPTGKDIYMEFDRAKNWSFEGGELTSRLDNGDMVMSFHFIDSLEREQTIHAEKEPIPLYRSEWAVADNRELFREIVSENERFAKMASEVIGNGKNPIDSVKALVGEFGMERTAFLTALNIVAHPGDGRFYPADKEWACKVLSPNLEVSPDEVIHRTPEKEQLFERMIDGGKLYSIHNTHLAQFAEALMPEYEKYLERSRSAEKTAPTLEVGDFIEYKGKEYKVESLDPDDFITLSNPEFSGPVKDRVTFIADEFINSGEYKVIKPKTEPTAEAPDKSDNFTITDDSLGEGGAKSKFRANVDAIRVLKTLEAENRPATAEEKETLSRYVGWGAIPQAFDKSADKWSAEYKELSELLTPEEYRQARSTVGDAFYTSPTIIEGIYEALSNFGFEGGNVLEPAMGVGNFFGCMPKEMQDGSHLYGVEIDSISGRIAQALYPDADIAIQGFEKNSFQNGCFDVAVGNVPFGELGFKEENHLKAHPKIFYSTFCGSRMFLFSVSPLSRNL